MSDSNVYGGPAAEQDFVADIEIEINPVTNRRIAAGTIGDNTLIDVTAPQRVKLYRAILTVNADITGEVILKLGAKELGGSRNPKSGGQYVLCSEPELGAAGEDLVVNLPSTTDTTVNIAYELEI